MAQVGFGGGCHWCTEAVFHSLLGVQSVSQGYVRSDPPHETFSEAVDVELDPNEIAFDALIRAHLATRSSTSDHKMRGKYRSAIYTPNESLAEQARNALIGAVDATGPDFVTQVLARRGFKFSDEKFPNYHNKNAERPFCRTYVDPKLAKIRKDFAPLIETPESAR